MLLTTSQIGLATPVADGATGRSAVINTLGLTRGAVGLSSDHGGNLSVQRYADSAGSVPVSAPVSVAVVANTPVSVGWSDGLPCSSMQVSFANNAGAVANLTNVTVLLSP